MEFEDEDVPVRPILTCFHGHSTDMQALDHEDTLPLPEYDLSEPQAVELLNRKNAEHITPTPSGPLRSRQSTMLLASKRAQTIRHRKTTSSGTASGFRRDSGFNSIPGSRSDPPASPPSPPSPWLKTPIQKSGPSSPNRVTPLRSIESVEGDNGDTSHSTEASQAELVQAKRIAGAIRSKEYTLRKQAFTGLVSSDPSCLFQFYSSLTSFHTLFHYSSYPTSSHFYPWLPYPLCRWRNHSTSSIQPTF